MALGALQLNQLGMADVTAAAGVPALLQAQVEGLQGDQNFQLVHIVQCVATAIGTPGAAGWLKAAGLLAASEALLGVTGLQLQSVGGIVGILPTEEDHEFWMAAVAAAARVSAAGKDGPDSAGLLELGLRAGQRVAVVDDMLEVMADLQDIRIACKVRELLYVGTPPRTCIPLMLEVAWSPLGCISMPRW